MRIYKIVLGGMVIFFSVVSVVCAFMIAPPVSDMEYAVVQIGTKINDEDIVLRFNSEGIRNIESASTQTVFLDDFGKVIQIPLHQYDDYIFEFDPRNDGYSEKIKRFFYQDGKQFIFIPFAQQDFSARMIISKIDEVLKDIPHTIQFIGKMLPKKLPWLLFFAAVFGVLSFFKKLRSVAGIFFPMAGFTLWGPSGFILSALLVIFFAMLINPLRELLMSRSFGKKRSVLEQLSLYQNSCIAAGGFFVLCVLVMLFTDISVLYTAAVFVVLWGLFYLSLQGEINRSKKLKHSRFLPLPISGENMNIIQKSVSALPFAAAAVFLILSSFFLNPGASGFDFDETHLVSKSDFEAHLNYQQNFSFIPLGKTIEKSQYKTYQLGDDGLVFDNEKVYSETHEISGDVSFPLEDLVHHIAGGSVQPMRWLSLRTIIPIIFFLILVFFAMYARIKNRGRKKIISMYNDKRIAA